MERDLFIWSDGWYIENDKAWFVDGERDTLYSFDFNTQMCKYMAAFPNNNENKVRLNPICIKIGNDILSIPDRGEYIWIYNLENAKFNRIKIDNPGNVRLSCGACLFGDKIFVISGGLKKIIELDSREKMIAGSYTITNLPDEGLNRSVKVGKNLYILSTIPNKIYQFDLESKMVISYILPGIERKLFTINYDGVKFWLSGYKKEIHVWDQEKNHVETLYGFPEEFGEYDFLGEEEFILDAEKDEYKCPTFIDSRVIGENIWFIPFQTNKIIYINRNTYKIQVFEMPDEEETKESLISNNMAAKYLIQYVSANRYLGVFSFKNRRNMEIDTECFQVQMKKAVFDFERYIEESCKQVFGESNPYDRRVFDYIFMMRKRDTQISGNMRIGEKIYKEM